MSAPKLAELPKAMQAAIEALWAAERAAKARNVVALPERKERAKAA